MNKASEDEAKWLQPEYVRAIKARDSLIKILWFEDGLAMPEVRQWFEKDEGPAKLMPALGQKEENG
ncbi:MAG: hypothetical protein JSU59_09400 [Nitrospirota bacterium]|nr:MAG: hypothetical protein JSU59_09400 [Nitrospirota bacterium]